MATATDPLVFTLDLETINRAVLRPPPGFTDDDFFDFCQQQHKLLRIERNADGEIIIMAPVGFEGGAIEGWVYEQLSQWARGDGRGLALVSNIGIKLPDGSTFSSDTFWISRETWKAIPRKLRRKFAPLVPPFVIEIRSPSDRMKDLHEKMLTYQGNGVELGWLIDPIARKVRIYKQGGPFIELDNPARVEAEGPVAGFVLDLKQIYHELEA